MDRVDTVVIGAGVVGLAVARALALLGREVVVLERESTFGSITSARNSEVIHAGIYYPAGSLKARLCVEGRDQMYAYCEERAIPHQRCGKLIVATNRGPAGRFARHLAQGVRQWPARPASCSMPPRCGPWSLLCMGWRQCILPPPVSSTATALMLSLLGDLEQAGGMLVCHSPVIRFRCRRTGWRWSPPTAPRCSRRR